MEGGHGWQGTTRPSAFVASRGQRPGQQLVQEPGRKRRAATAPPTPANTRRCILQATWRMHGPLRSPQAHEMDEQVWSRAKSINLSDPPLNFGPHRTCSLAGCGALLYRPSPATTVSRRRRQGRHRRCRGCGSEGPHQGCRPPQRAVYLYVAGTGWGIGRGPRWVVQRGAALPADVGWSVRYTSRGFRAGAPGPWPPRTGATAVRCQWAVAARCARRAAHGAAPCGRGPSGGGGGVVLWHRVGARAGPVPVASALSRRGRARWGCGRRA